MTGHYRQMREAHEHQREEDKRTWKRMQFTSQELDDLQQALAAFATQPLDAAQSARIHALQQRIESSAAVLIKRSITQEGHGLVEHVGPGSGWVMFAEPPGPLEDTIPF